MGDRAGSGAASRARAARPDAALGSLGVSLLVLVAGTFLVPALSLRDALIHCRRRRDRQRDARPRRPDRCAGARAPAMVLLRAPLGRRGSTSTRSARAEPRLGDLRAADHRHRGERLADRVFGFEGKWLWALLFGAVAGGLALLGPISFIRQWVRRFAPLGCARLARVPDLVDDRRRRPRRALDPSRGGRAVLGRRRPDDRVARVLWLPLIADYTRFARGRKAAFRSARRGLLDCRMLWLYALGALIVLSRGISDSTDLMTTIAAGGLEEALALLALTVDESDEAFANVYSTAVSLQNVCQTVPLRVLILVASGVATLGALTITWAQYEAFLFLLGSFFVPLFGVLGRLADGRAAATPAPTSSRRPRSARAVLRLARRGSRLPVAASRRADVVDRPDRARVAAGNRRRCRASPRRSRSPSWRGRSSGARCPRAARGRNRARRLHRRPRHGDAEGLEEGSRSTARRNRYGSPRRRRCVLRLDRRRGRRHEATARDLVRRGTNVSQAGGAPARLCGRDRRREPGLVVFAGRNRLYMSRNGGRFCSLAPELPDITAVALA